MLWKQQWRQRESIFTTGMDVFPGNPDCLWCSGGVGIRSAGVGTGIGGEYNGVLSGGDDTHVCDWDTVDGVADSPGAGGGKDSAVQDDRQTMAGYFCHRIAGMYLANLLGTLVTMILGIVKGSMVSNNLLQMVTSNNIWANVIVVGILAPIIEEYVFRKLLIDRTIKYGKELPY